MGTLEAGAVLDGTTGLTEDVGRTDEVTTDGALEGVEEGAFESVVETGLVEEEAGLVEAGFEVVVAAGAAAARPAKRMTTLAKCIAEV